jgi:hypothetical protein
VLSDGNAARNVSRGLRDVSGRPQADQKIHDTFVINPETLEFVLLTHYVVHREALNAAALPGPYDKKSGTPASRLSLRQ